MRNPTSTRERAKRRTLPPASDALREQVKTLTARIDLLEDYLRSVQKTQPDAATSSAYDWFVKSFQRRVAEVVHAHASILVVSRGDPALLAIPDRETGHFPQDEDADYRGFYPADDTAAIAHLEILRDSGYDTLVVPEPSAWWLDHYQSFRQHLQNHYAETTRDAICRVFDLRCRRASARRDHSRLERVFADAQGRLGRAPDVLDWTRDAGIRRRFPHLAVAESSAPALPHADDSVDIVAIANESAAVVREARRVAALAIVIVAAERVIDTQWLSAPPATSLEDNEPEDTIVCAADGVAVVPGAVAALVATLRRFPHAGAVGGRIVDFAGCLYHAAGEIAVDGTLSNRGDGHWRPDDPRYTFVHPADYCSSLFMAIRRRAFEDVGGLDESMPEGAVRDADFCLRLQQRGYLVYYQPEAVAVCSAALTAALRAPQSDYQRREQQREFAVRWKQALLSRVSLGNAWAR